MTINSANFNRLITQVETYYPSKVNKQYQNKISEKLDRLSESIKKIESASSSLNAIGYISLLSAICYYCPYHSFLQSLASLKKIPSAIAASVLCHLQIDMLSQIMPKNEEPLDNLNLFYLTQACSSPTSFAQYQSRLDRDFGDWLASTHLFKAFISSLFAEVKMTVSECSAVTQLMTTTDISYKKIISEQIKQTVSKCENFNEWQEDYALPIIISLLFIGIVYNLRSYHALHAKKQASNAEELINLKNRRFLVGENIKNNVKFSLREIQSIEEKLLSFSEENLQRLTCLEFKILFAQLKFSDFKKNQLVICQRLATFLFQKNSPRNHLFADYIQLDLSKKNFKFYEAEELEEPLALLRNTIISDLFKLKIICQVYQNEYIKDDEVINFRKISEKYQKLLFNYDSNKENFSKSEIEDFENL